MELRPYQEKDVDALRKLFLRYRSVLHVLSTGGGKTAEFSYIAMQAEKKGKVVVIVVHRQELILQTSLSLASLGVVHNIIASAKVRTQCITLHANNGICGILNNQSKIYIASVALLHKMESLLKSVDLLVIDEAHHAVAGMWMKCISQAKKARILGVTATPERLDGKGLGDVFQVMHEGIPMMDLIKMGYLSQPKIYVPDEISMDGVHVKFGDYVRKEIESKFNKRIVIGSAVDQYKELCSGLPAIAYCCTVKHAEDVAKQFTEAGFISFSLDGSTDPIVRANMIRALGRGEINVLTSCDVISEGTDIPMVAVGILLRPTKSLTTYLQQCGRVFRSYPGKEFAYILDHAGNFYRHGYPQQPREWSLKYGAKARKKQEEKPISIVRCPQCFHVHEPQKNCPSCGHEYFELKKNTSPNVMEGELKEMTYSPEWAKGGDVINAPLRDVLKVAETLEQLEEVARVRGYKSGWVKHVYRAKTRRRKEFINGNEA